MNKGTQIMRLTHILLWTALLAVTGNAASTGIWYDYGAVGDYRLYGSPTKGLKDIYKAQNHSAGASSGYQTEDKLAHAGTEWNDYNLVSGSSYWLIWEQTWDYTGLPSCTADREWYIMFTDFDEDDGTDSGCTGYSPVIDLWVCNLSQQTKQNPWADPNTGYFNSTGCVEQSFSAPQTRWKKTNAGTHNVVVQYELEKQDGTVDWNPWVVGPGSVEEATSADGDVYIGGVAATHAGNGWWNRTINNVAKDAILDVTITIGSGDFQDSNGNYYIKVDQRVIE